MDSKFVRLLLLLVALAFFTACSSSGPARGAMVQNSLGQSLPAPDTTSASGAYKGATDYRVGAQDLLSISVFGVEELNKDVRVNSNGQISLPLIGSVMAGGQTIPELEAELARRYSVGYLQKPQVTVFVKEFTSQRITLEGAINKPGIFPLTGKTSLLQAIALGGGLDDLADLQGIVLFRTINGKRMAAAFDMKGIRSGRDPDPQVYGDDIIVVEKSGSKSALRGFIKTLPALGFFMGL